MDEISYDLFTQERKRRSKKMASLKDAAERQAFSLAIDATLKSLNKDREKVDWENMEITSGLPKKETENALNNGGRDGNAPDRRPRVRSAEVNPPQADRPRTQPRREPQARREPLARPQQKNRSKDYDFDDDFDFEFIDV